MVYDLKEFENCACTSFNFSTFLFIFIFILLTCKKATETLIQRISNDSDLLSEMPRYCYPLVI